MQPVQTNTNLSNIPDIQIFIEPDIATQCEKYTLYTYRYEFWIKSSDMRIPHFLFVYINFNNYKETNNILKLSH